MLVHIRDGKKETDYLPLLHSRHYHTDTRTNGVGLVICTASSVRNMCVGETEYVAHTAAYVIPSHGDSVDPARLSLLFPGGDFLPTWRRLIHHCW